MLGETRAICTCLEDVAPEPTLMGGIANCIRHTHPGLAPLEQPQFPDSGRSQGKEMRKTAHWLDSEQAQRPFMAGDRFTIADITAYLARQFARELMKFRPGTEGMHNLQAWCDRTAERPSAMAIP